MTSASSESCIPYDDDDDDACCSTRFWLNANRPQLQIFSSLSQLAQRMLAGLRGSMRLLGVVFSPLTALLSLLWRTALALLSPLPVCAKATPPVLFNPQRLCASCVFLHPWS